MKAAVMIPLDHMSCTCSLGNIVEQHIKMFVEADINVKLITIGECSEIDNRGVILAKRVEWVDLGSRVKIRCADYTTVTGMKPDAVSEELDAVSKCLNKVLSDADVCLLYDIAFQEQYLLYNSAIRRTQRCLPGLRFISYTSSYPVSRPSSDRGLFSDICTPLSNTVYVSPTSLVSSSLVREYGIPEERTGVVNDCLDILRPVSEDVKLIANKTDLLSSDILMVYPARLTTGKKFEKVVTFAAAIKKRTGKSVKVVICDFPSSDINPDLYKALIRRLGRAINLNDDEVIFTSDLNYKNGFPRSGVLDLFTLSNLFVCPSFSESFGLMTLEAASRGNFIVLNEKVPALEELGQQLNTYFMRWDARNFGFDTKESYHPSEQDYLEEHAEKVVNLMAQNPTLYAKTMVRQYYSPKSVWENQLKPLLTY